MDERAEALVFAVKVGGSSEELKSQRDAMHNLQNKIFFFAQVDQRSLKEVVKSWTVDKCTDQFEQFV